MKFEIMGKFIVGGVGLKFELCVYLGSCYLRCCYGYKFREILVLCVDIGLVRKMFLFLLVLVILFLMGI